MSKNRIKMGDVVILNHGNHPMLVESFRNGRVFCLFNNKTISFEPSSLNVITKGSRKLPDRFFIVTKAA